ncbi:MAG: hypothetical protein K8W52_31885 [Deltaproteobacteria bacterium]|nr:hypothetical protein [Deltaproteobacteria bacterium]
MRPSLILAALALTASACTHHYKIAAGRPLPAPHTAHGLGAIEGGGLGMLAGAAIGAAAGYSRGDDLPCAPESEPFLACNSHTAGQKAAIGGILFGGLGAVTGLVVGAAIGSREVYESEDGPVPRISASVTPGGASATAAWSF